MADTTAFGAALAAATHANLWKDLRARSIDLDQQKRWETFVPELSKSSQLSKAYSAWQRAVETVSRFHDS